MVRQTCFVSCPTFLQVGPVFVQLDYRFYLPFEQYPYCKLSRTQIFIYSWTSFSQSSAASLIFIGSYGLDCIPPHSTLLKMLIIGVLFVSYWRKILQLSVVQLAARKSICYFLLQIHLFSLLSRILKKNIYDIDVCSSGTNWYCIRYKLSNNLCKFSR